MSEMHQVAGGQWPRCSHTKTTFIHAHRNIVIFSSVSQLNMYVGVFIITLLFIDIQFARTERFEACNLVSRCRVRLVVGFKDSYLQKRNRVKGHMSRLYVVLTCLATQTLDTRSVFSSSSWNSVHFALDHLALNPNIHIVCSEFVNSD